MRGVYLGERKNKTFLFQFALTCFTTDVLVQPSLTTIQKLYVTLEVDSSVPLTRYDPRDLGLICLVKKRKIHFRILSDLRI